ncbi:hypothetical protein [Onishia taeanensis]|uniref:hypothetical protein n=1 Tax=Onishia taeanensis TaxID=284577 RepID=UPI001C2EBED7|nr:hypothetical protein [Halomonas taeanensis]MDI4638012.1 hypothetical protein [Halomonas sp. BMC7]
MYIALMGKACRYQVRELGDAKRHSLYARLAPIDQQCRGLAGLIDAHDATQAPAVWVTQL